MDKGEIKRGGHAGPIYCTCCERAECIDPSFCASVRSGNVVYRQFTDFDGDQSDTMRIEAFALTVFDLFRVNSIPSLLAVGTRAYHLMYEKPLSVSLASKLQAYWDDMVHLVKFDVIDDDSNISVPEDTQFIEMAGEDKTSPTSDADDSIWAQMRRLKGAKRHRFMNLFSTMISHVFFEPFLDEAFFEKLPLRLRRSVMFLAMDSRQSKIDYCTSFLTEFVDFIKSLMQYLRTGDPKWLEGKETASSCYAEIHQKFVDMQTARYPEFVVERVALEEFLHQVDRLERYFTGPDPSDAAVRSAIVRLHADAREWAIKKRIDGMRMGKRIPSYGLALIGATGIGKTTLIAQVVYEMLFDALGIRYSSEYMHTVKPGQKYHEGISESVVGVVYDDPNISEQDIKEGASIFQLAHAATGGECVEPPMAFERKGLKVDPAFVTVLSNSQTFGMLQIYIHPIIILRRFDRWIVTYCGPDEYKKKVGVDIHNIPREKLLECFVFTNIILESTGGMNYTERKSHKHTFNEFLCVLRNRFQAHRECGAKIVAASKDGGMCTCGCPRAIHPASCSDWKQLAARVEVPNELYRSLMVVLVSAAIILSLIPTLLLWAGVLAIFVGYFRTLNHLDLVMQLPTPIAAHLFISKAQFDFLLYSYLGIGEKYPIHRGIIDTAISDNDRIMRLIRLKKFLTDRRFLAVFAGLSALVTFGVLRAFFNQFEQKSGREDAAQLGKAMTKDYADELLRAPVPVMAGPQRRSADGAAEAVAYEIGMNFHKPVTAAGIRPDPLKWKDLEAFHSYVMKHRYRIKVNRADNVSVNHVHLLVLCGGLCATVAHIFDPGLDNYIVSFEAADATVKGFDVGGPFNVPRDRIVFSKHGDLAYFMWPGRTMPSLLHLLVCEGFEDAPKTVDQHRFISLREQIADYGPCILTSRSIRGEYGTTTTMGYEILAEASLGDCGRPLTGAVDGEYRLIGVLIAGTTSNGPFAARAMTAIICKDEAVSAYRHLIGLGVMPRPPVADAAFQQLTYCEGLEVHQLSDKSYLRSMPEGYMVQGSIVGTVAGALGSTAKQVMYPTGFSGSLGLDENKWVPATAKRQVRINEDGTEWTFSWKTYFLMMMARPKAHFRYAEYRQTQDHLSRLWEMVLADKQFDFLSLEDALRGVPGTGLRQLPLKTSSGNIRYKGDKRRFVNPAPKDFDPDNVELSEGALQAVVSTLETMASGFSSPMVYSVIPKMNEVVSIAKAEIRPARSVNCTNFTNNVIMRYALSPFIERMMQNSLSWGSAIGVNAMSPQWGDIRSMLLSKGFSKFSDADTKGMDFSCTAEDRWGCVYERVFTCIRGYYPPELYDIATHISAECMHWYPMLQGDLFQAHAGEPSGSFTTTWENTIMSIFFLVYAYIRSATEAGFDAESLPPLHENVVWIAFGDDVVFGASDAVASWFNPTSYQRVLNEARVEVTFGSDKNVVATWKDISEVTFLKRRFDLRDGIVWAPLEIESIEKMLCWHEPSKHLDHGEQLAIILENAGKELFMRGEIVYKEWLPKLRATASERELRELCALKSYEEMLAEYLDGAFRAW